MLSLSYFGTMSVSLVHTARSQTLTLTPRVAELLAFLALRRGQFFTRSEIADSVWDHSDCDATEVVTTLIACDSPQSPQGGIHARDLGRYNYGDDTCGS
jgi:DNA-binding SARP family transcriptional activator